MANSRATNAGKINDHALYTNPARLAVPILQWIILLDNIGITCTGATFVGADVSYGEEVTGSIIGVFCVVIIPFFLSLYSLASFISRYRRNASASQIQLSSSLHILCWLIYIFIAPFWWNVNEDRTFYSVDALWAIFAAPGLVLNAILWGFAGVAGRKEKKKIRGLGEAVALRDAEIESEYERSEDIKSPPPSYLSVKGGAAEYVVR